MSGLLFTSYIYIHEHWSIFSLPWDSSLTWVCAAVGIDFCYYWVHRMAHEVNILWAAHQVHHSSEEYNLTTALRQSALQTFGSWPFYLPLALFVPPSHAIVHKELNLLYQFWIHTEVVKNIGPLEYIFNTASHHRVHHGANQYCLDKNYAGVLIIWDRMFGTFEAERSDIDIVYGLVDQPQFWNPLKHQIFYYGKILEKAMSMNNLKDFMSAFVKGPGWFPGTQRLGDVSFVPKEPKREKYGPAISPLLHIYAITHFFLNFLVIENTISSLKDPALSHNFHGIPLILYVLWGLTSIGFLYEKSLLAWPSEFFRCFLTLVFLSYLAPSFLPHTALYYFYAGSLLLSIVSLYHQLVYKHLKSVKHD